MAKRVRENKNRFVTIISVNMKREKKKHWSEDGRHVNGRPFKLNLVLRWEDYTRLQAVIIHCVEFYSRKLNEISKKSHAKGSFNLNSLKEMKKKRRRLVKEERRLFFSGEGEEKIKRFHAYNWNAGCSVMRTIRNQQTHKHTPNPKIKNCENDVRSRYADFNK